MNRFACVDVMRSVAGRLSYYIDAFPNVSEEGKARMVTITMPPRRVYFKAFADSFIVFSDFLFGDENAKTVSYNAKKVFGITLDPKIVLMNIEKSKW